MFKESVKFVLRKFQGCFKNVSMKFCSCMDLIAATRAEGGLVSLISNRRFSFDYSLFWTLVRSRRMGAKQDF